MAREIMVLKQAPLSDGRISVNVAFLYPISEAAGGPPGATPIQDAMMPTPNVIVVTDPADLDPQLANLLTAAETAALGSGDAMWFVPPGSPYKQNDGESLSDFAARVQEQYANFGNGGDADVVAETRFTWARFGLRLDGGGASHGLGR